jgi:hypothetical protein
MQTSRVFGLDLTRAVAISLVLFTHASFFLAPLKPNFDPLFMVGYLGVDLFLRTERLPDRRHSDRQRRTRHRLGRALLGTALAAHASELLPVPADQRRAVSVDRGAAAARAFLRDLRPEPRVAAPAVLPGSVELALEEVFYLLAPLSMLLFLPFLRQRWQTVAVLCMALALALVYRTLYVHRRESALA